MVTVLDNPEKVKEVDKSNMLDVLTQTSNYCIDAIKRAQQIKVTDFVPKNIIVVGMGGSAIGGEILRDWLRDILPISIEVNRNYTLPAYVNKDTLVFVNSYSGNTEETITAFLEATKRGCTVLAVTSGGLLEAFSEKMQIPCVKIPSGLQPRAAIPYMFFPLPVLMQKLGILQDIKDQLTEAVNVIEKIGKANASNVPTKSNQAKLLATEIVGSMPVVYGFGCYTSVCHRLKAQFNENSKLPCRANVFPELNHNEAVGYEAPEELNNMQTVILIRDLQEPKEIRNRIEATKSFALSRAKKVLEIWAEGTGKLAKMFSVLVVGDYVSVYLAVLQDKDPTPVNVIVKVKKELARTTRLKDKFEAELAKL
jgi:glucose/mannose-6-phosphate isomerase